MSMTGVLSPSSLITHGGSSARGEDLLYSCINTLQKWDTALGNLLAGADTLFGHNKDPSNPSAMEIAVNEVMTCRAEMAGFVTKLHGLLSKLKGLCKLMSVLEPDTPLTHPYFKTLSLVQCTELLEQVVAGYTAQHVTNDAVLEGLFKGGDKRQLLAVLSCQTCTRPITHYRTILYVDCVK